MKEPHKLSALLEYIEVYLQFEKEFIECTFRKRSACWVLVSLTCYSNVNVAFLKVFICNVLFENLFQILYYALYGLYMAQSCVFIALLVKIFFLKSRYACLACALKLHSVYLTSSESCRFFCWRQEREFQACYFTCSVPNIRVPVLFINL